MRQRQGPGDRARSASWSTPSRRTCTPGNAMNRRMFYQYGVAAGPQPVRPRRPGDRQGRRGGHRRASSPRPSSIVDDIEELTVDGVRMVFQNTPGTEAPAEMNTWFPDLKAFWAAENITGTIHNIYTLRGALVRDALEWSRQINKALYLFGQRRRGHVRVALVAAVGQRPHPGGDAHAARHLRPPEQRRPAPRQPGRDDQRDPQRLPGARDACSSSGRRAATTAPSSTTPAPSSTATSGTGTPTRPR